MKIQILDLAKADLIEGYHFYEEREAGLGDYFLSNLYTDIDSLAIFGGLHSKPYRHSHRRSARISSFILARISSKSANVGGSLVKGVSRVATPLVVLLVPLMALSSWA